MWILKKISLYKWDKDWLSYKKVYRDEVKTSGMIHLFAKFIRKVYKHTWQSLSEITGGRGIVFATGTPISNSMTEMYSIQRYLQYGRLQEMGMGQFDSWASRFGETTTALELAPVL